MTNVPTRIEASAAPDLYVVLDKDGLRPLHAIFTDLDDTNINALWFDKTAPRHAPHRVVHYTAHQEATQPAQDAEARELLELTKGPLTTYLTITEIPRTRRMLADLIVRVASYLAKGVQASPTRTAAIAATATRLRDEAVAAGDVLGAASMNAEVEATQDSIRASNSAAVTQGIKHE